MNQMLVSSGESGVTYFLLNSQTNNRIGPFASAGIVECILFNMPESQRALYSIVNEVAGSPNTQVLLG